MRHLTSIHRFSLALVCACVLSGPLYAQTQPKDGECKPDELDMGDYCASLPPATTQTEKERRRITRFRGESMMPGRTGSATPAAPKTTTPEDVPDTPVITPPEPEPSNPFSGYSVQLGAFSSRELAQSVAFSIESPDSKISLVPLERGERVLWACVMGPFPDNDSAMMARDRLRKDKRFRSAYIKPPQAGANQEITHDSTQE